MTNEPPSFDLVVIGAGTSGEHAANAAIELGASVALIEFDRMGGTCLNYGCDPTKALLEIAKLTADATRARRQGLIIPTVTVDWPAVRARTQTIIHQVQGAPDDRTARQQKRDKGIAVFDERAHFLSPHEIAVGDRVLHAKQVVIATGSRATVPDVDGLEEAGYVTNREAHTMQSLPRRLAVAGGGPIGVEYAQIFARFGCEVTLIEGSPEVLPKDEPELAELLCGYLSDDGIELRTGHELIKVETRADGKCITVEDTHGARSEVLVDEILVAIGREAVTDTLDLHLAGVAMNDDGSVKVDEHLRTNVPHIWASGDVLGRGELQFTHVASPMGQFAARNALGAGEPEAFDTNAIPWCTYSEPALAHLGAMESELQEDGTAFSVVRQDLSEMTIALTKFESEGRVKLLVAPDGKLLGAHILAPNAGDLIAPLTMLMRNDLPLSVIDTTLMPFPSTVGVVRTAATQA
jgi:pyruvate/2-oxoglutarate dehydrogenase complex dihydrolipoamide dehydrogenase (E3) component